MLSFASPLASQIGFLIASLNKSNYKSLSLELSQLADNGLDGSILLLHNCLEQFDLREDDVQKLPVKLNFLALVVKKLVHQPNSGTVFCEALRHMPSVTEGFLENLSKMLKLSLPEQIGLGLALTDAEEFSCHQAGRSFFKAKISEISQNSAPGLSEGLIEKILWTFLQSEGLSRHVQTFVKALPSLEPDALTSLLLRPLLHEQVHEFNCLRYFAPSLFVGLYCSISCLSDGKTLAPFVASLGMNLGKESSSPHYSSKGYHTPQVMEDADGWIYDWSFEQPGILTSSDMLPQLSGATSVADVLEELGYSCTMDVEHCKEIFSLFSSLTNFDVAQIVGMVARTYKGLEDLQGTHDTFCTAFCDGEQLSSVWLTTWDVDVLLEAINQIAPSISWRSVMENLDHEGFSLPDQRAFSLLLTIYNKACQDPFPLEAVCGKVWRHGEGQLSFLKHAVTAPPEIFTFVHSSRRQAPLENIQGQKLPYGTPNHAWLSLDLLEALCNLAEMGHFGSVRALLDLPLKHCPELLVLGLAQIQTEWNTIQSEIVPILLPTFFANNTTNSVLHQLWTLNPEMVTRTMVEMHASDPSYISRILDVCQELKAMNTVLETTPFSVSIELAAIASRRDFLNLEKWLQDNLTIHRDSFFQACLKFLRERTLDEARVEEQVGPGITGQRPGPIISLTLDTTNTFFKVLQVNAMQVSSRDLADELKRVKDAAIRVNPRLMSAGASDQSQAEIYSSDVEEEANSYFQRIYIGQLSIDNVVEMLQRFNMAPPDSREKAIFSCMLQSLFDEYRFFPRYPERELRITAVLFGSLVKHQLVSSINLGHALRCVLDALRKPLDSKMFSFALAALDQFKDRLVEWPQYCNHILQISHIREAHLELVEFIERALARVPRSQPEIVGHVITPADQHPTDAVPPVPSSSGLPTESSEGIINPAMPLDVSGSKSRFVSGEGLDTILHTAVQLGTSLPVGNQSQSQAMASVPLPLQFQPQRTALQEEEKLKSATSLAESVKGAVSLTESSATHQLSFAAGIQSFDLGSVQKVSHLAQGTVHSSLANGQYATVNQGFLRSARAGIAGMLRQPSVATGFGHALNIETLVAAAERRDTPIEPPSSEVQDKVAFIINNIVTANLEQKAKECLEVLKEQYYPWFAQYMVMKRASIEPNFHDLYLKFLDKMNSKALQKEVVKATYENCKVLLRSELIKSSSEERSLLKNLGSWLGKLTIGRNQALRAREVNPKALITEAYEKGLMIAVIPFTSKILEPCQSSLAYQPPNPWTMGILGLLAEIYALPNLKMNLKFDIEVLYKNLGVDMKDVKATQLLKGRMREIEGNPDFSNKDLHTVALVPPEPTGGAPVMPMLSQPAVELPPELSAPVPHPAAANAASLSQLKEEEKLVGMSMVERTASGQGLSQPTPSQAAFPSGQVAMSIPNLTAYVVLNPKLAGIGQQLQLSRIVPLAMERAIREIITPVVDRSVTIACMTTRELVMKDYAMEADEMRTHQAAKLMVASLAGSLAHVTCKEPLRVAMANHLRSLLQAVNLVAEVLEQAVNLVTNDNLDLGCAVIEKAATEKALGDLDEAIGPALAMRRKQRDLTGAAYYDATFYTGNNLARLPEGLRPKPGRLTNAQQRVYEDFARLPWQTQSSQPAPAAPAGPPPASSLSGQAIYGMQPSTGSITNAAGSQPSMTTGGITQVGDLSADELDIQAQSPLSISSTTSAGVGDVTARQTQDSSLNLTPFTGISTSTLESAGVEATSVLKGSISSGAPSPSPPLPTDQLGGPLVEPSLTTGEAIEKYQVVAQKLDVAVSNVSALNYSSLPPDHEVQTLVMEVQEIILQGISRDEAALAIAQKVFKRLYENTTSNVHVSVHLAILELIRDVCKRVVKELTSWVIYSDEERKFNREITVGLIRSELIILTDYNLHLAKLIDGGRNKDAVEFAAYLVKTCVIDDAGVSNTEFYNVIEALGKLAARPGSPESLQQLVEIAKSTSSASGQGGANTGKDDKARLIKDKKLLSNRNAGLRDDGKVGSRDMAAGDPAGLRDQVAVLFDEWARICEAPGSNDKAYAIYLSQLQHLGMLKGDDFSDRFFRILIELAVTHCLNTETQLSSSGPGEPRQQGLSLSFAAIDMFAKLVLLLVKYSVDPSMSKVNLLNKVLNVTVRVIQRDSHERKTAFHPRPYFRLFVTWLMDFNSADSTLDSSNFQVLTAFGNALLALQPLQVPGWSFAWLELISHRTFMPKLLLSNPQKGWPLFQRLLVALFKFMEPYLRNADVSDPVRLLYKGTLRVLLVLLHDFPEFLCDHHFSFCDVIPPSCIQMRNLILSAFPRNMRLPDPFTPNLKVDLLPEISQAPRILSDVESALKNKQLKSEVDDYLKTRQQLSLLSVDLRGRLILTPAEAVSSGTKYNVPLLNALVLYVGMQAIQQLQSKTTQQQLAVPSAPITHSAPMDIFQHLVQELDTEGRYLFLNAVANQLRYPNNHTHYFSCVLLYLFAEANHEIVQEQITRVLLERLIVNRPHPWGLLITFIELIKNPRYSFWSHSFTRCAPEIEKLFESVARSCMGPPVKPVDDDMSASLSSEGMKG